MLKPFPQIPSAKIYQGEMTPEQEVQMKLVHEQKLSDEDEAILKESILFYKEAYTYLKSVDLVNLTENDAEKLISFLNQVFNFEFKAQNVIRFHEVYRVSFVYEEFLEKGKVRNLSFLREPPLELVQKKGVYGRANSPQRTVFYAAANPLIAILETKPKVGDRIIIGKWGHDPSKPFVTYPIMNSKVIKSPSLDKARKAFMDRLTFNHPLFAEIMDLHMEFFSSEFVKDIPVSNPKKYEYLYSAYFADNVLNNDFQPVAHPVEPLNHYDALIYPSIAIKHQEDNLAIMPESVKKLVPVQFLDCEVIGYDTSEVEGDRIPIQVRLFRKSYSIENSNIIWEDD